MASNLPIIVVIYDSITNSVFYSQVLAPIKKFLQENPNASVKIVSFERSLVTQDLVSQDFVSQELVSKINSQRLELVVEKKLKFFGKISLILSARKLKKFLKAHKYSQVISRGPLAGWVAKRALMGGKKLSCLTVQARGLAAEEFRYAHERGEPGFIKRLLFKTFYKKYLAVERETYGSALRIETVSPLLREYLIDNFGANPSIIRVSDYDVPEKQDPINIKKWREEGRKELGISPDSYVYCYMGSAHAWQCVDEMISYVQDCYKKNKKTFFLFLSKDKDIFEKKLQQTEISGKNYIVKSVDPEGVCRYLSVADAGLLFRERDPVNWVSRPTKMLEYQAVGLKIIHNENIGLLRCCDLC